jgi:hypothetical protein
VFAASSPYPSYSSNASASPNREKKILLKKNVILYTVAPVPKTRSLGIFKTENSLLAVAARIQERESSMGW